LYISDVEKLETAYIAKFHPYNQGNMLLN